MTEMQKEHKEWVDRMYPGQPPEVPAAGMVEEAGELLHAVLKLEQERRWGKEERLGDLRTKLEDAIGDCIVYAVSFCNAIGWDFEKLNARKWPCGEALELSVRAVRVAAEAFEKPYTEALLTAYVALVHSVADASDVDFYFAVMCTWDRVKERTKQLNVLSEEQVAMVRERWPWAASILALCDSHETLRRK